MNDPGLQNTEFTSSLSSSFVLDRIPIYEHEDEDDKF